MKLPTFAVLVSALIVLVVRFGRVLELLRDPSWAGRATAITPVVLIVASGILWYRGRTVIDSPFLREMERNTEVRWGVMLVLSVLLLALFAPLLSPHDPEFALYGRLRALSIEHPLGTDSNGRDFMSRVLYGARLSLSTGVFATAIAIVLGVTVGVTSAVASDRIDGVLMRGVDAGLAFPRVFLLLALIALLPSVSHGLLIVVLGITSWFDIARIVRGEVRSLRQVEFVMATKGLGLPASNVITGHLLPNIAGPIIVSAALSIGYMILLESGLSYLGIGSSAGTPSWGRLIEQGYAVLRDAPHLTLIPGAMIAVTVVGFSLLGDGLRQTLDPRKT